MTTKPVKNERRRGRCPGGLELIARALYLWMGWMLLAGGWGCAWRLPESAAPDLKSVLREAEALPDGAARNAMLAAALHRRVLEFQVLVERNLELRERILAEANRLETMFERKAELEASDLRLVSSGAARYLQLRGELLTLVDRYQCLLEIPEAEMLRKGVDPRLRLVAVMVSVGAALTLYDNYLTTVVRFERSPGLRRYLNHGDAGAGLDRRQLEEIGRSARSIVNRGQLRAAIVDHAAWKERYPAWKARFGPAEGAGPDWVDEDFRWLDMLIHSSVSYAFVAGVKPARVGDMKLDALARTVPDLLREGSEEALRALTRVFVEAVALVEPRRGRLFEPETHRVETLATLRALLRPGDIVLEKSPFRLNDRMVPGYWGHAGIWLGTDGELEALGVWAAAPSGLGSARGPTDLRALVREGRSMIEAGRGGVKMNTLEHFINVDGLAVLRPRMNDDPARRAELREVLVRAMGEMGKQYDFLFDVHSPNRILCSELAFRSYTQPEFRWPRSSVLGRYSVTPDQLALRALDDPREPGAGPGGPPPLRLVALFVEGGRVSGSEEELAQALAHLLR